MINLQLKNQLRVVAFFLTLTIVACSSGSKQPTWVMRDNGAFDDTSRLYGVGAASGIRNIALLRQTADNRARANLAAILETYVGSMMKDYQASTSNMDKSTEEQNVTVATKSIVDVTLRGSMVTDRWQDPKNDTMYSLVVLDLKAFQEQLANIKELDARTRDYIRANAAQAFDELNQELEKRKQ